MQPAVFYGPGQQGFIPAGGQRGGMPFPAQPGMVMGIPGGRPGQYPGPFPGQQGGRGMGPNQQMPPNFAQGMPMGMQGPGGLPNGMGYTAPVSSNFRTTKFTLKDNQSIYNHLLLAEQLN